MTERTRRLKKSVTGREARAGRSPGSTSEMVVTPMVPSALACKDDAKTGVLIARDDPDTGAHRLMDGLIARGALRRR